MIETKVAKRYARSLVELSSEKGALEQVNDDMRLFISVCNENPNLALLLSSPVIQSDKKLNVLEKIFAGKMNPLTMTFFQIVIRKGREKYLIEIAKEFIDQYKTRKGIRTAEIISASGLDDNLRKQVYDIIRSGDKSEIELIEKVDNKLIGGFILRMGDKQYDASIASSLRKLAQTFNSNQNISKN